MSKLTRFTARTGAEGGRARIPALALIGGLLTACAAADLPREEFDVVIVGGSASGVGAAIGAARLGVRVALIEDTPVLGGMLANGIGNTDSMSVEAMSGVFREFTDALKRYYTPIMQSDPLFQMHHHRYLPPALAPTRAGLGNPDFLTTSGVMDPDEGGRWEPHVADRIFKEMVARYPNIKVYYRRHATEVVKDNNKVVGVITYENMAADAYSPDKPGTGIEFRGAAIVDATHEGDVAAWAGVPYRVGREPRSRLEPHAGSIYYFDRTGEILPGSTGQQDKAVVSYGERITIQHYDETHYQAHLIESPPPGYRKEDYIHSVYTPSRYNPNYKAEVNEYPFGSELQQANWDWPEASRSERERIYQVYKNHALGLLYYLQHEKGYKDWGLPTDDYTDNGFVPYRLYVREARRMVGEYTLSEPDINPFLTGSSAIQPVREDSVAVGHYPIDCKPFYTKTNVAMPDKGNGDFYIANATEPFQVPYGAMLPQRVDGLVFPTAASATHVAFCAYRMDPTWAVAGQAAGVAAALSAREHVELRDVPVREIQRELLKQKAELMFYWDLPLRHPAFAAVEWLSIHKVVDGYPDRLFGPDQALTRAEMAALLVRGLDVWPSVSNIHFNDVSQDHWAFRFVETLYDNQALEPFGIKPLWPKFGPWDSLGRMGSSYSQGDSFEPFEPSKTVTWHELIGVIHILLELKNHAPAEEGDQASVAPLDDPVAWAKSVLAGSMFGVGYAQIAIHDGGSVTRGQAAALVAALLDGTQ